jgi:hypothetical protein
LLHAQAGNMLARSQGTLGYLARELSAQVPSLIHALGTRGVQRGSVP